MGNRPQRREIVGLGVAQFLRVVWHHWRLAAPITFGGLALSLVIALVVPNVYESEVVLLPERPKQGGAAMLMQAGAGLPGLDLLGLGAENDKDLLASVLQSRTVTDAVIRRFDLARVYGTPTPEQTRRRLRKAVSVGTDTKSPTVRVVVADRDPGRARDIAAMYAQEADRITTEINTSRARQERQFLEKRLVEVKRDLVQAEAELKEFEAEHGLIDEREQVKATIQAVSHLRSSLVDREVELSYLRSFAASGQQAVGRAQREVAALRRQLAELEEGQPAPARAGKEASGRGSVLKSARSLPGLILRLARLRRNLKIQEALFGQLTRSYELAKVNEVRDTATTYLLDAAVAATEKSFPRYSQFLVIGLLLSFGLAVVVVHWRARREEEAEDDDDERPGPGAPAAGRA